MKQLIAAALIVGAAFFLWPSDPVPAPQVEANRAQARQWLLSTVQSDGQWPIRYDTYRLPTSLLCLGSILANDRSLKDDVRPIADKICAILADKDFGTYMRDPRAVLYTQTIGLWVCCELYRQTGEKEHAALARRCLTAMQRFRRQPGDWAYPFDPAESGPSGFLIPALIAARQTDLVADVKWLETMFEMYLTPMYKGESGHIRYHATPSYDYQGRGTDVVGWLVGTRLGWTGFTKKSAVLRKHLFDNPRWIAMTDPQEVDTVKNLNNFYYWAFAAYGARRESDPELKNWLHRLQGLVASRQNADGSFEPCDIWMTVGDRHYATAMNYWVLAPAVNMEAPRR